MWGRAVVVALAVLGTAGVASARGPKPRKVHIETFPPGATVYIDTQEDGSRGETPLDLELTPGTYNVIVELNSFETAYRELEVKKATRSERGKPVNLEIHLDQARARLRIEGAPDDATVKIDEIPSVRVGDYTDGLDITAGPHTVLIELDGKELTTEFVDVEIGTEKVITVHGRVAAAGANGGGTEGGTGDGPTRVTKTVTPRKRRDGPIVTGGLLVEVGWRNFSYDNNQTKDTNLTVDQAGETLIGVAAELNPFRLTGIRAFHPLAIVFAFGHGLSQNVEPMGTGIGKLTTFWQRLQAGLRYRIPIGSLDLDLEGGYASYAYQFSGVDADIARLPDASYQTVRIGGRLGLRFGAVEPYVGGENRVVISGGAMDDRYAGTKTQSFSFRGGFDVKAWSNKLALRAEATYSRFEWTFTTQGAMPTYQADGATDKLFGLGFVLGYAY